MASVLVRNATIDDLPRVVDLLQQMSLDSPREELGPPLPDAYYNAFAEIAADPAKRLLVAIVGQRIVGTAAMLIHRDIAYRGSLNAIVDNVVVDEPERSKGLGEALIRFCLEAAKEAGCRSVSLVSDRRRIDAHRFYERLGFKQSHLGFRYIF